MDMLKRNLFFLGCGFAAVVGIVLGGLGLKSMADVRSRMGSADTLLRQLGAASTVNGAAIEAEKARIETIRSHYRDTIEWAFERNRQDPLVAGVFPTPRGQKKIDFIEAYQAEIERLLKSLDAGEPPTARDIEEMRDKIKNERPLRGDAFAAPETEEEERVNRSGLITDREARTSPAARAALVKAQSIRCYAGLESLHVIPEMYTSGIELASTVLWDAQRTLWVQQNVVAALAGVNERAAEALLSRGEQAWVGALPVKDLVSIRVSDYVFEDSDGSAPARAGGLDPAKPPGTPQESFSNEHSKPDGLYDVLHFTVKLVVDARQLPAVLDAMCRNRFYSALRVSYLWVAPNLGMTERIYGEDPVVSVVIDFEAYYFADIYRRLMPDAILEEIGAERPTDEDATG